MILCRICGKYFNTFLEIEDHYFEVHHLSVIEVEEMRFPIRFKRA